MDSSFGENNRSTTARIWGTAVVWEKSRQTTYCKQLEPTTQAKSSLQMMQEFEEIYGIHPPHIRPPLKLFKKLTMKVEKCNPLRGVGSAETTPGILLPFIVKN